MVTAKKQTSLKSFKLELGKLQTLVQIQKLTQTSDSIIICILEMPTAHNTKG